MGRYEKLLLIILQGGSDANIPFEQMLRLLIRLGFTERVRGSHHIFIMEKVVEIINLQPNGKKAKPYQVKQVRSLIVKYKLEIK